MLNIILAILLIGEILYRWRVSGEWTRKFAHTVIGVLLIALPWLWTKEFALGVGVFFTLVLFLSQKYNFLPSINQISRSSYGGWLFPLGISLAVIIGWDKPAAFQLSTLTLALADTSAWLAGKGYLGESKAKTWQISGLFALVSLFIWISLGWTTGIITTKFILAAAYFSLVISVVEHYSYSGLDNLFIPLLASFFGLIVF